MVPFSPCCTRVCVGGGVLRVRATGVPQQQRRVARWWLESLGLVQLLRAAAIAIAASTDALSYPWHVGQASSNEVSRVV
jgi:hypothetical protein